MRVILIIGPPGAGKSTVATLVHDRLGEAGVANALIEADDLRRAYPDPGPERLLDHLAFLAASYRDAGHDLLFVTETAETPEQLAALRAALGGTRTVVVRLDVEPGTARARVEAREWDAWAGLPDLLVAAERLAVAMRAVPADVVVDAGAPLDAVVEAVRAAAAAAA